MDSAPFAWAMALAIVLIETDCAVKSFAESLPAAGRGLTGRSYWRGRAVYALLVLGLLGLVCRWNPGLVAVAGAATAVASLDRLVWRGQQRLFAWTGLRFRPLQALPMLGLAALAWVAAGTVDLAPSQAVEAVWRGISSLPFTAGLEPTAALYRLAGFVFLAHPVNYLIRWFLDKEGDAFLVEAAGGRRAAPRGASRAEVAAGVENDRSERRVKATLRAGRVIGILERWTLVTLVLLGQYGALGLVLTAKSVARFKEMEKSSEFAEYYLLGTLCSTLSALVVGVALAAW